MRALELGYRNSKSNSSKNQGLIIKAAENISIILRNKELRLKGILLSPSSSNSVPEIGPSFSELESSNAKTRMMKTKLVPKKNGKRHATKVAELRKTTTTEIMATNLDLEEERTDGTTAANGGSNAYDGGYGGSGCYI
ncbi:hypothetical protein U1Q18_043869 [Sarracenia purpurea var. burkii]